MLALERRYGDGRAPMMFGSDQSDGEDDGAPLAALAGEPLDGRFRSWRGRSGRRYVFSVYHPASCPAYEDAVLLAAAVAPDGGRRPLFIGDTGCFPDIVLARGADSAPRGAAVEMHVHLLAGSRAGRDAVLADLAHLRAS